MSKGANLRKLEKSIETSTSSGIVALPQQISTNCSESVPPNGSCLSCGRPTRRRKAVGRQSVPRQEHNTPLPLERSPPAGFKRLLGSALTGFVSNRQSAALPVPCRVAAPRNPDAPALLPAPVGGPGHHVQLSRAAPRRRPMVIVGERHADERP